jgi:AdoMet-dependent heme synthase
MEFTMVKPNARPPVVPYRTQDFAHSPLLVFFETTRACNLLCKHCRADAQPHTHPDELTTANVRRLIDELTTFRRPPLLVLTGGDPMKRRDIFEIVEYAAQRNIDTAMTPSATRLVTTEAIANLALSGLKRFAVSLDAADAASHDGFRGVPGSFERTMQIVRDARACNLPVQINTTITRHNIDQIDAMAELLAGMDIVLWSVFFLIPTGRGLAQERITAMQYEDVFAKLHGHMARQPYAIKTTEAPHFRRYLLTQNAMPESIPLVGTNDGKGVMFVSHIGEIYPSGFLPILCGKFPLDSLVQTYQKSECFRALRDASRLGGKCGVCEYHDLCGGSRARSYALTGDPLAAEPDCAYVPADWRGA